MNRAAISFPSSRLAIIVLIAVVLGACGGSDATFEDTYDGGPIYTDDILNPVVDVPRDARAGFHDTFEDPDGSPLLNRPPEFGAILGSAWDTPLSTSWAIDKGSVVLNTTADQDFRAVIDVGRPRNWVRARVVREGGKAGLVTRYRDEENWVMVWSDGESMIAGQQIDGTFTELGRQDFDWPSSSKFRHFDLIDTGVEIAAFVAGQEVVRFEFEEDNEARGVGFFSRASKKNRFDDFTVWAASADALGAE